MDDQIKIINNEMNFDNLKNVNQALQEKLIDISTSGFQARFNPEEADRVGALIEDAINEQDAFDSTLDLLEEMQPLTSVVEVNKTIVEE